MLPKNSAARLVRWSFRPMAMSTPAVPYTKQKGPEATPRLVNRRPFAVATTVSPTQPKKEYTR